MSTRDALNQWPTTDLAEAAPGVVRVRGHVRLYEAPDAAFSVSGTCRRRFSIVDDTGEVDVESGAVMTAWDLASRAAKELRDGDRVEAIGYVSRGPFRPGRGFRDVET